MKDNYQNDEFLRKRRECQRKIRKRRFKLFLVLFLAILLMATAVLSVTVLFPIKSIMATGSKIYTAGQIIEACGIQIGDNLIMASQDDTLNSLKLRLSFVDSVEFERKFPNTLKIKVTDAKEYVCYKVGKQYFTVSESGWVLKSYTEKPNGIMLIISDKVNCKVGSAIGFSDESVSELCKDITAQLHKHNLSAEYVDVNDKLAISAKINGRFVVNFGTSDNFESKIKHLVAMIKELGEKATGKIDLSMWSSQNTQGTFVKGDIK